MKMKWGVLIAAMAGLAAMGSAQSAQAQAQPKSGETSSSKARGDMAPKSDKPLNVEGQPKAIPPGANAQSRGMAMVTPPGWVCVYNHSGYYIDIQIDGQPYGTVNPGGIACGFVGAGTHTLYGYAPGTTSAWGATQAYLSDGYNWHLNP